MMSNENPKKDNLKEDVAQAAPGENAKKIDEAELYNEAAQILSANSDKLSLYQKARTLLEQIPNYKDSSKLLEECTDKIVNLTMKETEKKRKRTRIITLVAILIGIIIVGVLVMSSFQTVDSEKQAQYDLAVKMLENAKTLTGTSQTNRYNQAYEILAELGTYNNASDLITTNRIERVKTLTDEGKYDEAIALYQKTLASSVLVVNEDVTAAGNYITETISTRAHEAFDKKDYYTALELFRRLDAENTEVKQYIEDCQTKAIEAAKIGDVVKFGTYQLSSTSGVVNFGEDLDWIVLAKNGNKYLLITEKVIDLVKYNNSFVDVTWKDSTLRSFLNGEFSDKAFTEYEFAHLTVTALGEGDGATSDKVFVLSREEALEYLDEKSLKAEGTEYANFRYPIYDETYQSLSWWLRDTKEDGALAVDLEGAAKDDGGYPVNSVFVGVRPAVWITVD